MADLNPKQRAFVGEYLIDLNATQAAIRAGYSERTARSQGQRLLTHADIQGAISEAMQARGERTQITADEVLREVARVARANLRDVVRWDANGIYLMDSDALDDDAAAAVAEVTIKTRHTGKEDAGYILETKVKMHPKMDALGKLMQHFGLLRDEKGGETAEEVARRAKDLLAEMERADGVREAA